jgi:long-chain fatty acid transport protein
MGTPIYAAVAYKVLDNLSLGLFSTPFGSTVNGQITGKEKKWYRILN